MKINKVTCYIFTNHFLISLHASKSIVFARLRYPVCRSAQGSNAKVTVEEQDKSSDIEQLPPFGDRK